MRTRLVYEYGSGRYHRAVLPGEDPGAYTAARFEEGHTYMAKTYASMSKFFAGEGKNVRRHIPDGIRVGSNRLELERGVCSKLRFMPEEIVDAIDQIDEQIKSLIRERNALLEDGYARGRKLRAADLLAQEVKP